MKNVATAQEDGARELAVAEEPEVDQRLGDPQLDDHERDEHRDGQRGERDDPRRGEAVARRLDQRVGQRRQEARHQQLSGHVDAAGDRAARARHHADHDHERDGTRDRVEGEHRAPPEPLGERAAHDRPEPRAESRRDAPEADGAGALARLGIEVRDDREARGRERRAAERLQHPEDDQQPSARRQRAQERAAGEERVAGAEHPLAAEAIGQETGTQQQARADEVVGVDHPRRLIRRHAQVGLQRRQRDDHDRDVQRHEEDAERQREERDRPVLGVEPGSALHRGHRSLRGATPAPLDSAAREA